MNHPNRDRARELRKNMTETEKFVWARLRREKLGGYKFRRQHPLGPFIVDFVCLERKLVLELDGGQHAEPGAHRVRRPPNRVAEGTWLSRVPHLEWNSIATGEWDGVSERIWQLLQDPTADPDVCVQ